MGKTALAPNSIPTAENLKFLPRALTDRCRRLIESYHGIHGYASLPDILWRANIREFVELNDDVQAVFRKASIARSALKANSTYVLIGSMLLATEILASDFLGWGARFPWAKKRAVQLMQQMPSTRILLKEVYLAHRSASELQSARKVIIPDDTGTPSAT